MPRWARVLVCVAGFSGLLWGPACSGNDTTAGASGAPACAAVTEQQPFVEGVHVDACTPLEHATNPPSSGNHYPAWADFGVYDFPLPRGYWVHNLEHGAVVVTYNCPQGCAEELADAKAWLAQLAPDATCPAGPTRILLVPDPLLDVPWAASAWGFTLRAECFDADTFTTFFVDHAGGSLAPEAALCGTGFDFRADGANICGAK